MTVMLYKYPGPHKLHGDKFDYTIVDENQVEAKLSDGWFKTTTEAKAKHPQQPKSNQNGVLRYNQIPEDIKAKIKIEPGPMTRTAIKYNVTYKSVRRIRGLI